LWTGTTTEITPAILATGVPGRTGCAPPPRTRRAILARVAALVSIDEALERVLARVQPLPAERIPLAEAAGRVLAEPARARVDLPPFPSSAMDGFAVHAADTPGRLPVADRIAAGVPARRALERGHAMGIATGGVVPEGADAVVPVEYVVEHGNEVEIPDAARAGANVRPRGGDASAGDVVVASGVRLGPARIGALAAAGLESVVVACRPSTAVLVTGTELRRPGEPLGPGEVYEANGLILQTALAAAGALVEPPVRVADEVELHRAALERSLGVDLLVSSGGVSVGPHDLVRSVGAELGVEEVFWGVAVKPGKPAWFGVRGRTLVFGLPGNPVSALVGFELFVRPAVLALQGHAEPRPRFLPGTLGHGARRNPTRDQLLRARTNAGGEEVVLDPVGGQESHMIVRAAGADALVLVPRGEGELAAGSRVRYLVLADGDAATERASPPSR
jgi:molybdopterin molybdotransferase